MADELTGAADANQGRFPAAWLWQLLARQPDWVSLHERAFLRIGRPSSPPMSTFREVCISLHSLLQDPVMYSRFLWMAVPRREEEEEEEEEED